MILPALVALPVALGPLFRGSWDVWAQSAVCFAAVAGLTAWLVSRVIVGYLPLPSSRNIRWVGALVLLGSASLWAGLPRAQATPAWMSFLNALWLFLAMAALSKDERFYVDEAVRVSAWALMILAAYQRFSLHERHPASAMPEAGMYAGAVLMLIPLALEKKDWLLAAGLILNLWWTRSVGAWLGLSGAILLTRSGRPGIWRAAGYAIGFVCLIVLYNRFESPEALARWSEWKAAAAVALRHPFLGLGPGSLRDTPQYFLQLAGEYGIFFTLIWLAGLWHCLLKGSPYKRFGAFAAFIHSMGDRSLSLPSNLWLFSYFSASSIPEGSRGVNIPARYKAAVCAFLAALGWIVERRVWVLWGGGG